MPSLAAKKQKTLRDLGLSTGCRLEIKLRVDGTAGRSLQWFPATLGERNKGRRDEQGREVCTLKYVASSSLPLAFATAKVTFSEDWMWDLERKAKSKWRMVEVPTPEQAPKRRAASDSALPEPAPKRKAASSPAQPKPAPNRRTDSSPALPEPAPKQLVASSPAKSKPAAQQRAAPQAPLPAWKP